MNGIEKITARIKKDAGAEAEAIRREGEERAASIRAGYKAQAEENAKAAAQAGKEAAKRQEERLVSAAQMDAKKLLLAAKQACIDEAFDKAQSKLLALPDGEYAELLAKLAVKAAKTGKEEILLSAKDRKPWARAWPSPSARRPGTWPGASSSGTEAWRSTAPSRPRCASCGRAWPPMWPPSCSLSKGCPIKGTNLRKEDGFWQRKRT